MEAIVLAGGFGNRLREVVPDLPKPMAPVAGKPFLEILLCSLSRNGFSRVIMSLGFMADKIADYFGDRFVGMELAYVVEDRPLGTGGAVRLALSSCQQDHAFIFNGDTFLDLEAAEVEAHWQAHRAPIIVVREAPDAARFGRVEMRDGRIHRFLEKESPGPGLINAGCYVLPKHALDDFPLGQHFSLEKELFAKYLQRIRFDGFVTRGRFIDIGVPDDYVLAQTELAGL